MRRVSICAVSFENLLFKLNCEFTMKSLVNICFIWLFFAIPAVGTTMSGVQRSIVLVNESRDENFVLAYYQNEFQDQVTLKFELDPATGRKRPLTIAVNHALLLQFATNAEQYMLYVQPGDSIFITTHPGKSLYYTFKSSQHSRSNTRENNFFNNLKKYDLDMSMPDFVSYFLNKRYANYIEIFKNKYDRRLKILNHENDSIPFSNSFYNFALQQIKAQYLLAYFHPFYDENMSFKEFPSTFYESIPVNDIKKLLSNDSLLLVSFAYRSAAVSYVRYLCRESIGGLKDTEAQYQMANTYLKGRTKDYVEFFLLKHYFGKDPINYDRLFSRFKSDCTTHAYVRYLDSLHTRPAELNKKRNLLATKLMSNSGKIVSWQDILKLNKGKVIYVDLWASWCGPCIAEMPASLKLQKSLSNSSIVFLYISIDSNVSRWKNAIAKYNLEFLNRQHYRLDQDSELAKFMNAPPIPRYLIINKDSQVVSLDAARPSSPILLHDLKKAL